MVGKLRENWQQFIRSRPGRRFQDRYHRLQQSGRGRFDPRRIFYVFGGIAFIFAGLFMVITPGPGWLTIFLGLAFIAGQSLLVARFLDWGEVEVRNLARWSRDFWKGSPLLVKASISLVAVACLGALAYGGYYLLLVWGGLSALLQ